MCWRSRWSLSAGIVEESVHSSCVTCSSAVPGGLIGDNAYLPEGASTNETHAINNHLGRLVLSGTYDLEMVEGRWFEEGNPTDSFALIISESAVQGPEF